MGGVLPWGSIPGKGFVTWKFTEEQGRRDYYWGHYYDDGPAAEKDYADRAADYQRRFKVQEVKQPIAQQMREAAEQAGDRPPPPRRETHERGDRQHGRKEARPGCAALCMGAA